MPTILHYGLTDDDMRKVEEIQLDFDLVEAGCATDVMALYAELAIIDPTAFPADEVEALAEFYREVDPMNERAIITGPAEGFEGISCVDVVPEFFDEGYDRTIAVMRRLKETKRDIDISRRITNSILILKLIGGNPGITTAELSRRTELSERTVRRYIRSLQAAMILIDYENRGWRLVMDPRELVFEKAGGADE